MGRGYVKANVFNGMLVTSIFHTLVDGNANVEDIAQCNNHEANSVDPIRAHKEIERSSTKCLLDGRRTVDVIKELGYAFKDIYGEVSSRSLLYEKDVGSLSGKALETLSSPMSLSVPSAFGTLGQISKRWPGKIFIMRKLFQKHKSNSIREWQVLIRIFPQMMFAVLMRTRLQWCCQSRIKNKKKEDILKEKSETQF